ncbi:MAG: hypothetical protein IIZ34_06140 [Eubacterium sp.]|nr:hypothetical protein [Eubacterium sp.]
MATTEAQKRYYRKWSQTEAGKQSDRKRHQTYRQKLLADPVNQKRIQVIKDYLYAHGYLMKWLALQLGCSLSRIRTQMAALQRIKPEEYKVIPDLYEQLMAVAEGRS